MGRDATDTYKRILGGIDVCFPKNKINRNAWELVKKLCRYNYSWEDNIGQACRQHSLLCVQELAEMIGSFDPAMHVCTDAILYQVVLTLLLSCILNI